MLEILAANPNKQFSFDDEKEAKTLVLELNLTGRFSPNPAKGQQSQQSVLCFDNLTHFIQVILYLGNPDPNENGFVVFCYPRSKVSYEKLMGLAKSVLNE